MRYRLLGNSGLRVSEAALGTMTFGDDWGWGAAKDEARKVYDAFRGQSMWAQVKGRTEDALLALFPSAYMFRLGALRPMHGAVSKTRWTRIAYAVFRPLFPLVQAIAPGAVISTESWAAR